MQPHKLILTLIMIVLVAVTEARNCNSQVRYCGHTLGGIGNCYKWGQLQQMLFTSGDTHYRDFENVLFLCVGGDSGVVEYIKRCPGNCIDSGTSADDYCQSDATIVEQQPEYDL